jgi:hypothetical protein
MKITRRQLRKLIHEAEGFTLKHNDDPALKGKQSDELPDSLQKSIIDKLTKENEENEENETNEYKMNEKELKDIINEITAEIFAESPIDPGDGEFTEEEGLLMQQLSDDAVEEESLENDDREEQNSFDAISDNEVEGKLSFDEWVEVNGGHDAFGPNDNAYDIWLRYSNPERYDDDNNDWYEQRHINDQDMWQPEDDKQNLLDKHFSSDAEGGVLTDDEDELLSNYMQESKEFAFDKFMKDINGREDKIAQHKKELTENEGDSNARLKQKLYQEDWRNSVKFKG